MFAPLISLKKLESSYKLPAEKKLFSIALIYDLKKKTTLKNDWGTTFPVTFIQKQYDTSITNRLS